MSTFVPRSPRFDLHIPLTFKSDVGIEHGFCVNVSASGMLATFQRPVDLFTVGELSMLVGDFFVTIKARVARIHNQDHGLAFKITTDSDRRTVEILVEYAASKHQPPETRIAPFSHVPHTQPVPSISLLQSTSFGVYQHLRAPSERWCHSFDSHA